VRLSSSVRISTSPQSRRRHGRRDTREASTKNRCDSRPHFRTRCQDTIGDHHNIETSAATTIIHITIQHHYRGSKRHNDERRGRQRGRRRRRRQCSTRTITAYSHRAYKAVPRRSESVLRPPESLSLRV
uniref:Uncharacterized protein n=1 Tax=Caenorhabditis japonica TaxID=281687 RepID=A0A8R1ES87_CAEJA